MADKFYGVNRGGGLPIDVSEAGSTTGRAIEVRVNDTVYTAKLDVIIALKAVLAHLETKETWPIA